VVRPDVAGARIARAQAWLTDAEGLLDRSTADFVGDRSGRDLALFYLFLAIQECIDLAALGGRRRLDASRRRRLHLRRPGGPPGDRAAHSRCPARRHGSAESHRARIRHGRLRPGAGGVAAGGSRAAGVPRCGCAGGGPVGLSHSPSFPENRARMAERELPLWPELVGRREAPAVQDEAYGGP